MGMVPIPAISPLTVAQPDEPMLEPPLPISRVENSTEGNGGGADEAYSPGEPEPPPNPVPHEAEAQSAVADSSPANHISYFA